MTTRNSTRDPAGSSHSTIATEECPPAAFNGLLRRLLVEVYHVRLVAQHFGDLSSLSEEDAPAGLTLHEAAKSLDRLYNEIDIWELQQEHRPKTVTVEPTVARPEESHHGRTEGQRLYDDVLVLERELRAWLAEVPYAALGDYRDEGWISVPEITQALDNVETHLQEAVSEIRKRWPAQVDNKTAHNRGVPNTDDAINGQRLYHDVADLERQVRALMNGIAPESLRDLPESHPTAQAFLTAEVHLQDAVAELRKVRDAEVPRSEAHKGGES